MAPGRTSDVLADPAALRSAALAALPRSCVVAVDREMRIALAEGPVLAIHGHTPEQLTGSVLSDHLSAPSWAAIEPGYRAALAGEATSFEFRAGDGETWFWVDVSPLHGDDGEVTGAVSISQDITARKRAELARRDATAQFETAFSLAPIGMAIVGLDGRFLRCNAALCQLTGYPEPELRELTFQDITHPEDLDADITLLDQVLAGELDHYSMEKRYFTKQGHQIWVSLAVALVKDAAGVPVHFISQIKDVSERRRMLDRLQELAEHDPVTDLYNRRRFEDELERQLARRDRYQEDASLLVVDVDDFKAINDRHGHKLGDTALRAVARVMRQRLRAADVIARVGGDEFSVLLPNTGLAGAAELAEDVRGAIAAAPIALGGQSIAVTVSIGVHTLGSGTEPDPFVAADRAMYRAKAAGKDQIALAG